MVEWALRKEQLMTVVGLGLLVWNAVWGPQSGLIFTVCLILVGVPQTLNVDKVWRKEKGLETPRDKAEEDSQSGRHRSSERSRDDDTE
jgi:hypothetical protein